MDPADQAHQVDMATQRLDFLDATVLAQERFGEVSEVIATSADKYAARAAVARLLGVREDRGARAITELSWFRLTGADRRRTREERDAIIAERRPGCARESGHLVLPGPQVLAQDLGSGRGPGR